MHTSLMATVSPDETQDPVVSTPSVPRETQAVNSGGEGVTGSGHGPNNGNSPIRARIEESKRLISLAHGRKRNRLEFFNGTEGVVLRLSVRGHIPKQGPLTWCALCGQNKDNDAKFRGHRSTYSCQLCSVFLCMRIYPGLRKSCWDVWHTKKELKPRKTPLPATKARSGTNSGNDSSVQAGSVFADRRGSSVDDAASRTERRSSDSEDSGSEVAAPEETNSRPPSTRASTVASRPRVSTENNPSVAIAGKQPRSGTFAGKRPRSSGAGSSTRKRRKQ